MGDKLVVVGGSRRRELLHAAEANRKHLVRLVRREVEAAVAKLDVNRLSGEVQALGATVAGLAAQVDDLARSARGMSARTPGPVADALVDIDPGPDTSWDDTLMLARLYRVAVDKLGLVARPKVTG